MTLFLINSSYIFFLKVTALNGFGSTIFAGTSRGCLLILVASSDSGQWEEEAKLQLSEESVIPNF
jgi:hypothetical protein